MNRTFIISDTHFNHMNLVNKNIRPSGFEELIMKNLYNLHLKPTDTLINLGDFAWIKDYPSYFNLPCKLVLVKGNHDRKSYGSYSSEGKFDFCCESFSFNYMNKRILFSHKPLELGDMYDLNIHGHLHGDLWHTGIYDDEHYLIALETNGYKAENLNTIVSKIIKKEVDINE